FYIYPIAGIRKLDERMPILKASKNSGEKAESKKGIYKLAVPFIIILVVIAAIYAGLVAIKTSKKSELKKIKDYINSPDTIAQVAEYDAMYENMAEIGKIQGGADLLHQDLDSYPTPDSSINNMILTAAKRHDVEISFKSYSATTGIFNITASSPVVDDINMFIADLMEMDIFESVDYTGYSLAKDGSSWQINVVCILAENAAEEEVN
ncbi:MAG: hypothetical protein J6Z43_01675, partial [Clostridiales bacterium]|nr:hypothetical protein [Clostridiales bacterium]